jgi:hypothetical protein
MDSVKTTNPLLSGTERTDSNRFSLSYNSHLLSGKNSTDSNGFSQSYSSHLSQIYKHLLLSGTDKNGKQILLAVYCFKIE